MSGWTGRLLVGVAELLAGEGVGTWSTTAAYAAGQTGIVLKAYPPAPDRVVVLTPYPVTDHQVLADSVTGLQIRTRGLATNPTDVDDLADAVFEALHGLTGVDIGGVQVAEMHRQSYAQLGRDQQDRFERSDNYYVAAMHANRHRPY